MSEFCAQRSMELLNCVSIWRTFVGTFSDFYKTYTYATSEFRNVLVTVARVMNALVQRFKVHVNVAVDSGLQNSLRVCLCVCVCVYVCLRVSTCVCM